jgi:hypothetical protein
MGVRQGDQSIATFVMQWSGGDKVRLTLLFLNLSYEREAVQSGFAYLLILVELY